MSKRGLLCGDARTPDGRPGVRISTLSATAPTSALPSHPQRIVRDVRKVMLEASSALTATCRKFWFARNYRTHVANTLLLTTR